MTAISWQSPIVKATLPAIDTLDGLVCARAKRTPLPRFSERVRSNGVWSQFGGRRFVEEGKADLALLRQNGFVSPASDVLDIGCGVGRLASAFARSMRPASYRGLDIDRASIEACRANPLLCGDAFSFIYLDVESDLYNPGGRHDGASEMLPLDRDSADLIVAMSLFTHLFADECEHYASEMLRILRPGGVIVVTAFVLGVGGNDAMFPHDQRGSRVLTEVMPRKGVAQSWTSFADWFGGQPTLLRGQWGAPNHATAPRGQDWVVVRPR